MMNVKITCSNNKKSIVTELTLSECSHIMNKSWKFENIIEEAERLLDQ